MSLTYKKAREIFDYRDDGKLIWKVRKSSNTKIGSVAGSFYKNSYSQVRVDAKDYMAHRVIWLWHHGYTPEGDLDHINRVKSDNRIENLREVSRQCNTRNTGNQKDNKSGVKGVYTHESWGNVWRSFITIQGRKCSLGNHKDFDEAVLHRLAAEQCLNWDGCDSSSPAYRYALENGLVKACGE